MTHSRESAREKNWFQNLLVPLRLGKSPAEDLVEMATGLWVAMKDKTTSMPMTDGGYLKLYQLGKPRRGCTR